MPKSTILTRAWQTEGKILVPPGVPMHMYGDPSLRTMVGAMELSIRFPPATELAFPGLGSKSPMQLLRSIPVPWAVTFEPKAEKRVWVAATMFPSESMAETWVVLPPSPT